MPEEIQGDVSGGTPPPGEVQPPKPAFTEEQKTELQQLIADTTSRAKEEGRREMQGIKDREVAKERRERQLAEETLQMMRGSVGDLDPEVVNRFRSAELSARDRFYRQREAEEARKEDYFQTFEGIRRNMTQFITEVGLDPSDKRIDWGNESQSLLDRERVIQMSLAKLQQEQIKNKEQELEKKLRAALDERDSKLRKELGVDSVVIETPHSTREKQFAQIEQDYVDGKISTAEYEQALAKRKR